MNLLGITPNILYRDLKTYNDLKRKIEVSEKIDELPSNKIEVLFNIIDVLKEL
jgi:hypothetical protein